MIFFLLNLDGCGKDSRVSLRKAAERIEALSNSLLDQSKEEVATAILKSRDTLYGKVNYRDGYIYKAFTAGKYDIIIALLEKDPSLIRAFEIKSFDPLRELVCFNSNKDSYELMELLVSLSKSNSYIRETKAFKEAIKRSDIDSLKLFYIKKVKSCYSIKELLEEALRVNNREVIDLVDEENEKLKSPESKTLSLKALDRYIDLESEHIESIISEYKPRWDYKVRVAGSEQATYINLLSAIAFKSDLNLLKNILFSNIIENDIKSEALSFSLRHEKYEAASILLENKTRIPSEIDIDALFKKLMIEDKTETLKMLSGKISKYYNGSLHYAIEHEKYEAAAILLEKRYNAEAELNGTTALEMIASLGHLDLLKTALNRNISQDIKDRALKSAIEHEKYEAATILLEKEADSDIELNGTTSLEMIASVGHLGLLKTALNRNISQDIKDRALKSAVENKKYEAATFLLNNDADAAVKFDGLDVFNMLILQEKIEVLEVAYEKLLAKFFNSCFYFKDSIELAIKNKKYSSILFFLRKGDYFDYYVDRNNIVLQWLILEEKGQLVQELFDQGIEVDDFNKSKVLYTAINESQYGVVESIIKNSKGVSHIIFDDRQSLLEKLILVEKPDLLELALQNRDSIKDNHIENRALKLVFDRFNSLPLKYRFIKILLQNGANPRFDNGEDLFSKLLSDRELNRNLDVIDLVIDGISLERKSSIFNDFFEKREILISLIIFLNIIKSHPICNEDNIVVRNWKSENLCKLKKRVNFLLKNKFSLLFEEVRLNIEFSKEFLTREDLPENIKTNLAKAIEKVESEI